MRVCTTALLGSVLSLAGAASSAAPYIEHLEPGSVARGQRNHLTLVGAGVDRAVGIWFSLPPDKITARPLQTQDPRRSEFEIEAATDCPPGLYGLRLATEDGLSNLHLFLVDDLLSQAKLEESAKLDEPQVSFPVALAGQFRPAAVDRYQIRVSAGQRLTFDVVASRLGTDADPLVSIYDASGHCLAEHDNDPGLFFDCCFEQRFDHAGLYTVEVRDARYHGSEHWRYVLRIGAFAAVHGAIPSMVRAGETSELHFPGSPAYRAAFDAPQDLPPGGFFYDLRRPGDSCSVWIPLVNSPVGSASEVELNDAREQATAVDKLPVWLHGVFEKPGDADTFALDLKAKQKITVRAETKLLGSAADVELALFDSTGKELQRVDDVVVPGPGNILEEARLTFTVAKDGKYFLLVREVTSAGGSAFTYRLAVEEAGPKIQVSCPTSAITLPQQSYQMLSLGAVRTDYVAPIELSLAGGPPGLRLEPNVIPGGTDTLICKLHADASAPLGTHTLTIVAKGQPSAAKDQSAAAGISTVVATQPLVDRQLADVNLIQHALRDNQRFLPPSVTGRLALQVTPAAPFTVDLPDEELILPRYKQVKLPIHTTRVDGFEGSISFSATGGQLGQETERRKQVFARFPVATAAQEDVMATIHSRNLARDGKDCIDVVATAQHGHRTVTLSRCVTLAIRPAFEVTAELAQPTIEPGGTAKLKFVVSRLPSIDAAVTIDIISPAGIKLPATVTVNAYQDTAEVDLVADADCKPRRDKIRFTAFGRVGGYQEELRAQDVNIEVKAAAKAP